MSAYGEQTETEIKIALHKTKLQLLESLRKDLTSTIQNYASYRNPRFLAHVKECMETLDENDVSYEEILLDLETLITKVALRTKKLK